MGQSGVRGRSASGKSNLIPTLTPALSRQGRGRFAPLAPCGRGRFAPPAPCGRGSRHSSAGASPSQESDARRLRDPRPHAVVRSHVGWHDLHDVRPGGHRILDAEIHCLAQDQAATLERSDDARQGEDRANSIFGPVVAAAGCWARSPAAGLATDCGPGLRGAYLLVSGAAMISPFRYFWRCS